MERLRAAHAQIEERRRRFRRDEVRHCACCAHCARCALSFRCFMCMVLRIVLLSLPCVLSSVHADPAGEHPGPWVHAPVPWLAVLLEHGRSYPSAQL